MAWRLAKSLETLRSQINAYAPNRSKKSDGTIGDTAHSSRKSDHNPNRAGVVQAFDATHDPKGGFDAHAFAEFLRQQRDSRIKYVISNKRIFSATTSPWVWRSYSGSNPHTAHAHFSVADAAAKYDDTRNWAMPGNSTTPVPPPPTPGEKHPVVKLGSKGEDVKTVQRTVMVTDGDFGKITEGAVKGFQSAHGLKADGVVGPATWAVIDGMTQKADTAETEGYEEDEFEAT